MPRPRYARDEGDEVVRRMVNWIVECGRPVESAWPPNASSQRPAYEPQPVASMTMSLSIRSSVLPSISRAVTPMTADWSASASGPVTSPVLDPYIRVREAASVDVSLEQGTTLEASNEAGAASVLVAAEVEPEHVGAEVARRGAVGLQVAQQPRERPLEVGVSVRRKLRRLVYACEQIIVC
jgi:hypothetical protein